MKVTVGFAGCAAALALFISITGSRALAQQDPNTILVPFSDPSRIGKLAVQLISGGMTVKGENRKDVQIVNGRTERQTPAQPAPPGLRRLTQSPGFTVDEERNEMKISSGPWRGTDGVLEIRVPQRTNLKLGAVNGGPIVVENVEGDLEIQNVNGPVTLTNVSGAVVANSVNGGVTAKLTRVSPDKAMAFTSLNGPVDVTLPASVKANLKMRSDQGEIFTDFEVQMRPSPAPQGGSRTNGKYRIEVNRSIYGAVNGGGPEIELRTFNGTVYLRKGGQ